MIDTHAAPDQPAEEAQRHGLCPVCNGAGWYYCPLVALHVYTEPYVDCTACQGSGVITRPYTEASLYVDTIYADIYEFARHA